MNPTLLTIQYIAMAFSLAGLGVDCCMAWLTQRATARAYRAADGLERMQDDVGRLLRELDAVAAYAISVGGRPVADEIERLVDIASATSSEIRRRNRAGDYGG